MIYSDGAVPYGSLVDPLPVPVLIDAPEGAHIRLRFHQRDIVKAFIRYRNGTFSVWSVQWVDEKARTMKLFHPIANVFWQKPVR